MPEFAGKCGRRDGQDRAPGVGQAVAAYLGKDHPGQGAAAARADDQHIAGAAGKVDQHPAGRPPLDVRLNQRILGILAPHCEERVPEPLAGEVLPYLAQLARWLDPLGVITTGQFPGQHRDQDRIVGAGQALTVAQRVQAARGAARPDDHPADARHCSTRSYWVLAVGAPAASARPAWSARVTATRRA